MSDFFTFMAAPLAGCLILAIVFTYFGMHILQREIIFVDLSLAQLAALGITVSLVLGWGEDTLAAQLVALLFIVFGALFFSLTSYQFPKLSQEAVIGIVYVIGASTTILLGHFSSHAAEHIQHTLNGSILWINWNEVGIIAIVSSCVGAVLWKYREWIQISSTSNDSSISPFQRTVWNFVFYVLLGLVVAACIKTAGIFLVFALLIIPAVCGTLFFDSTLKQFIFGSALAIVASLTGLLLSFYSDFPTGPTIVCSFGIAFVLSLLVKRLMTTP